MPGSAVNPPRSPPFFFLLFLLFLDFFSFFFDGGGAAQSGSDLGAASATLCCRCGMTSSALEWSRQVDLRQVQGVGVRVLGDGGELLLTFLLALALVVAHAVDRRRPRTLLDAARRRPDLRQLSATSSSSSFLSLDNSFFDRRTTGTSSTETSPGRTCPPPM